MNRIGGERGLVGDDAAAGSTPSAVPGGALAVGDPEAVAAKVVTYDRCWAGWTGSTSR